MSRRQLALIVLAVVLLCEPLLELTLKHEWRVASLLMPTIFAFTIIFINIFFIDAC